MAEQTKHDSKISEGELNNLWADYKSSLQEMRTSKPAPGVKMVQFDQYGFPKGIGNYHRMFEVGNLEAIPDHEYTDPQESLPMGAKFIAAPQDSRIHLSNFDTDKEYQQMNEEEKRVFECMDNESEISQYEDLEDDFVLNANDNKPGVVEMKHQEIKEEEEKRAIVKPRVAGLLTKDQLAFLSEKEKEEDQQFNEVMKEYDEESSDQSNQSEKEYLLDRPPRHTLDDANFNAMIQEFLYRKEVPKKMLNQILPQKAQISELIEEEVIEAANQEIKGKTGSLSEKVLALVKRHQEEDKELFNSDGQLILSDEDEDQSNQEERWDVESYHSRVTNTQNHPHLLQKRKLDQSFLTMLLKKKLPKKLLQSLLRFKRGKQGAPKIEPMIERKVEEEEQGIEENEGEEKSAKQLKKEAKKKVKQEKKERREQKKQSKLAFKEEKKKLVQFNTNPNTFGHGLSVKRIM